MSCEAHVIQHADFMMDHAFDNFVPAYSECLA